MKITEKVAFNIASEASYVYFFSGQKFVKNTKNRQFGEFYKTLSFWSNSVARQVNFDRTKNWWKRPKFKCDISSNFQGLKTFCIFLRFHVLVFEVRRSLLLLRCLAFIVNSLRDFAVVAMGLSVLAGLLQPCLYP